MNKSTSNEGACFLLPSSSRKRSVVFGAVAAVLTASMFTGCGPTHGRGMPAVKLDAEASTNAAMKQYDTDGDGMLNKEELSHASGLGGVVEVFDVDKDSNISRDELFTLLNSVTQETPRLLSAYCIFTLEGRPLSDAKIVLEPVGFLVGNMLPATATTAKNGGCNPFVDPAEFPKELSRERGVRPGLYKVIVTHDQLDIPPKYNEETTLGLFLTRGTYPKSEEFIFKLDRG